MNEIERRRTFAIISHPDAGKTTLTEKLLLFGGQIQVAGAVKNNKIKKTATSDWMEIEKQRGISVTTSVMEFDYRDYKVNILDPGPSGLCRRYVPHADSSGQRHHRRGQCERRGGADPETDDGLPYAQNAGHYLHQ